MVGFINGQADAREVEWQYGGDGIDAYCMSNGTPLFAMEYGSALVRQYLDNEHDLFRQYLPTRVCYSGSLPGTVKIAENRIRALSSDEARQIDPKCHHIGGRITIATVTPDRGFSWVSGFEPLS
jgi:hypothetical protein